MKVFSETFLRLFPSIICWDHFCSSFANAVLVAEFSYDPLINDLKNSSSREATMTLVQPSGRVAVHHIGAKPLWAQGSTACKEKWWCR